MGIEAKQSLKGKYFVAVIVMFLCSVNQYTIYVSGHGVRNTLCFLQF